MREVIADEPDFETEIGVGEIDLWGSLDTSLLAG